MTYDSNPERVRKILLEIVRNHPHVMSDPEPTVTFSKFGDSALEFVVCCFLPDLDFGRRRSMNCTWRPIGS